MLQSFQTASNVTLASFVLIMVLSSQKSAQLEQIVVEGLYSHNIAAQDTIVHLGQQIRLFVPEVSTVQERVIEFSNVRMVPIVH